MYLVRVRAFYKINVHIIQCDEKVHTDKRITSRKEMKDYMEHLELYGDGGTDSGLHLNGWTNCWNSMNFIT